VSTSRSRATAAFLARLELGIEEAEIEHGVVRDQRRIAEEFDQLLHLVGEQRLVLEEVDAEPVYLEGRLRDVALRIEVAVERLAGWKAVDQLDAADPRPSGRPEGDRGRWFSVSNTISRIGTFRISGESFSPGRHLSNRRKDLPHLRTGMFHTLRAIHHEIRPPPLFFRVGHLPPQQCFEPLQADTAFQHAFRVAVRRGADTTTVASTRPSPPVSNSNGTSSTTMGAPASSASRRNFRLGVAHQRMHDLFPAAAAPSDRPSPACRAGRDPPCRSWSRPGKRRLDQGPPPRRHKACARRAVPRRAPVRPSSANSRAVVVLPIAIEPVRPMTNMISLLRQVARPPQPVEQRQKRQGRAR